MIDYKRQNLIEIDTFPFNRVTRYEGEYYGRVIDLDDPSGTGAIKVNIPELMVMLPSDAGIWVQMIYNLEGQKSNPSMNQIVIITFRDGDPNFPQFRGIVKHWDESNPEVNPHTTFLTNDHPKPTSTKLDALLYAQPGKNSTMHFGPTISEARDSYMPIKTPRKGHFDRFLDADAHSFAERKTSNGNTLVLSDNGDYALLHAVGDHQVMLSSTGYAELSSNNGSHAVMLDSKNEYSVIKSGQNMSVVLDDKAKAIFSTTGMNSDAQRAVGTVAHVMYKDPIDRFAPSVKARSYTRYYGVSSILNSLTHSFQGHASIGSMGFSKRGTGRATDYHIRSGYIFLNTF